MPATSDRQAGTGRPLRTGGGLLVDQLLWHGVDRVFCVPGESYLPVLDALRDVRRRIRLTVCRHEGGAANMAEAHAKLTGTPGVCFVTRGPGATQAAVGLHTASQDSSPMLLFVGQVPRGHLGRDAFQELDLAATFGGLAKLVAQVEDVERLPELVARAFHTALSGRPGPVVVGLPEDALDDRSAATDVVPHRVVRPQPSTGDTAELRVLLQTAERPLVIVGGGAWSKRTSQGIEAFAATNDLPVAAAFRRQDHIDNHSQQYVGELGLGKDPALADRLRSADVVIAAGTRLDEVTTGGYRLLRPPSPEQRLVHIHPDQSELGRVFAADLPINAGIAEFALAAEGMEPVDSDGWAGWRADARRDYLSRLEPEPSNDAVDLGRVMTVIRHRLPADAIVTNGAGNYTRWVHRYLQFAEVRTQLAPISGSMGYGVPAAIAAKLAMPQRTVVAFAGDGCFLMAGQELATAVEHGLGIVIIVVNNGRYGTIATHQERRYPGRPYGVELTNPDFAAYARAFGAHGEAVEATDEFPAALERALAADRPALIELRTAER